MPNVPGWTTLAEQPLVLLHEYSFGSGLANCVAVLLPDSKWLLMSPPPDLSVAAARALEARGEVVALVENNGHHLGLGPCGVLFPRAVSYARERAAARIRKKTQAPGALEPLERLLPRLGQQVDLVPVEGDKMGDLLLRIRTERGVVLYVGDYIANIPSLPKNPLARALFRLSDSAPGLKLFKLYVWFFVANRTRAKACLRRAIEAQPPAHLVPAHGRVVSSPELSSMLVELLR